MVAMMARVAILARLLRPSSPHAVNAYSAIMVGGCSDGKEGGPSSPPLPLVPPSAADAYGAKGRSDQVPPSTAVEVELQLLSWNKVEDVTPNGLVVKKIVEASSEWKKPNEGSQVRAHFHGVRGVAGCNGLWLLSPPRPCSGGSSPGTGSKTHARTWCHARCQPLTP